MTDPFDPIVGKGAGGAGDERIPESLIDAFLDGDLDTDSRRAFFDRLAGDAASCERLVDMQRIVSGLRSPDVDAPDLSDQILRRVGRRRGFLPPSLRAFVSAGRLAVAASVLLGVGVIALAQRLYPEQTSLRERPAPLTALVETTSLEATVAIDDVRVRAARAGERMADEFCSRQRTQSIRCAKLAIHPGEVPEAGPGVSEVRRIAIVRGSMNGAGAPDAASFVEIEARLEFSGDDRGPGAPVHAAAFPFVAPAPGVARTTWASGTVGQAETPRP